MDKINYKFEKNGVGISVEISILKTFEPCEQVSQSPLSQSINPLAKVKANANYDDVIIKCSFNQSENAHASGPTFMPQAICLEAIEQFVKENWPKEETTLFKTKMCNPWLLQHHYLIEGKSL